MYNEKKENDIRVVPSLGLVGPVGLVGAVVGAEFGTGIGAVIGVRHTLVQFVGVKEGLIGTFGSVGVTAAIVLFNGGRTIGTAPTSP